jgi:hypothetical protein
VPRKLGFVGDRNLVDYAGGPVYSAAAAKKAGPPTPALEWFDGLDSDERVSRIERKAEDGEEAEDLIDALPVLVYRVDLANDAEAFLVDLDWVDWDEIARFTGQDPLVYTAPELKTIMARAQAAYDVASVHGWQNLDNYPLELTVGKLRERWDA